MFVRRKKTLNKEEIGPVRNISENFELQIIFIMNRVYLQDKTENPPWIDLVSRAIDEEKLHGSTCRLYSLAQKDDKSLSSEPCLCGRRPRRHSYVPKKERKPPPKKDHWEKFHHATESDVTVYGIWKNKTKVFYSMSFILFNLLLISSFDGIPIEFDRQKKIQLVSIIQQSEHFTN
jgi:hypothetical protein